MMSNDIAQEFSEQKNRGVLTIITGPSGAGKTTVVAEYLKTHPSAQKIITTTSRTPRDGEEDGVHYFFLSREDFEQKIADDAFFEWVEFRGALYGTQKQSLIDALAGGRDALWVIEAKGVKNIKEKITRQIPRSVFVYIAVPDVTVLRSRVFTAEGDEKGAIRWNEPLVTWEMKQYRDCDYLLLNEEQALSETVAKLHAIIETKRIEIMPDSPSLANPT